MGCGNCAVQSGSLSKVADDKFTVIDTAGNKRTFTIGTSRITEGGTGFTSAEVKKEKKHKEKKKKRGYWGFWKEKLGGWVWLLSPILFVLWIPYLVLSIVWWILKKLLTITGIMFLLNVFGVGKD